MKAMAETDDMRHRVEGQEQRLTRYLAEKVDSSDVQARQEREHHHSKLNRQDDEVKAEDLPSDFFDHLAIRTSSPAVCSTTA